VKTLDEFVDACEKRYKHNAYVDSLIDYHRNAPDSKEAMIEALYDYLGFDFKGKSMLDLGPGTGESLDVARRRGATITDFININPFEVVYNELKGHRGYCFSYTISPGLSRLPLRKYDFILSKGSLNSDEMNRRTVGLDLFDALMGKLMAFASGVVVICPTFDEGTLVINGARHICQDPQKFKRSFFATTLIDMGFEACIIPGFNEPIARFPFTFIKRLA